MISTYRVIGDQKNLSIEYKNLYSINGEIIYFSLENNPVIPYVNRFTNCFPWKPKIIKMSSLEEFHNYLNSFSNKQEIDLSAIGDNIWYGNIGHALFDGLYPLYTALIKFGYINEDFTYLCSDWDNKMCISTDAMIRFSGRDIIEYNKLDKNKLIHFKTLIAGTGNTGNRIINENYTMYGEIEYRALSYFKNRMLSRYGIKVDTPINLKPKAIIIDNKRYSNLEIKVLNKIIDHYKENLDIKYIDWSKDYKSFADQLNELKDVDIHITGPGTGMMYMPFLKRGAVNINLGYIERTQTNTSRPNIKIQNTNKDDFYVPGWMEQSVCASANYVSTLYYDRYSNNEIEFTSLLCLIENSISILGSPKKNNHNIDAEIFKEYCTRCGDPNQICEYLTSIAFFIELFVNEHPKAIPKNIVDIDLLRQIKKEFNYDCKYDILV